MSFELDPLYLFYGSAALAAVLVVEALYLLLHNTKDHRTRVNRRLAISTKEADREKVLVQLRRERGLSSDGGYRLPIAAFNRLVLAIRRQGAAGPRRRRADAARAASPSPACSPRSATSSTPPPPPCSASPWSRLPCCCFGASAASRRSGRSSRRRSTSSCARCAPATRSRSRSRWWRASCRTRSAPSSAWSPTRSPTAPISKARCATWWRASGTRTCRCSSPRCRSRRRPAAISARSSTTSRR